MLQLDGPRSAELKQLNAREFNLKLPLTRFAARTFTGAGPVVRVAPSSAPSAPDLTLRISLNRPSRARLSRLQRPHRWILDLYPDNAAQPAAALRPTYALQARATSPEPYVVVIDPGHGGRAPGAVGPGGTLEKNVVLGVCRHLRDRLNTLSNVHAVLTREGDATLSLQERVDIARQKQADLFVSVHADAIDDPRVRGGSVYVLSNHGATNAARRWESTMQRATDRPRQLAGIDLSRRDPQLASVLYDLVQTDTLERSNHLAGTVLGKLAGSQRVRFSEVRLADLGVLKAPDVPSVLVETAFISNPDDERLLKSASGQQQLAKAIAKGIAAFLERPEEQARRRSGAAPGVQQAAAPRGRTTYAVVAGDTLWNVSQRFGVSVQQLRELNNLRGSTIRPGMRLRLAGG